MDAAAEFLGRAEFNHADRLPVFLAEQHHGARFFRLCQGDVPMLAAREVRQDAGLHFRLDFRQLLGRHLLEVGEIEPQAVGFDKRPLLFHVRPEHLAQRLVQEVRGAVVPGGVVPTAAVYLGLERARRGGGHLVQDVDDKVVFFFGVEHVEHPILRGERALVSHLATPFRVEGRLVKHRLDERLFLGRHFPVAQQLDLC